MNGIAPFWSIRTLVAFLIAPVFPGLLILGMPLFIMLVLAGKFGDALVAVSFAASISGKFGYPIAIVAGIPTYLFFARLKQVTYWHFLGFSVLTGAFLGALATFDFAALSWREDFNGALLAMLMFSIIATLGCTFFYGIVSRTEKPDRNPPE